VLPAWCELTAVHKEARCIVAEVEAGCTAVAAVVE
jgi:hypothetical protein